MSYIMDEDVSVGVTKPFEMASCPEGFVWTVEADVPGLAIDIEMGDGKAIAQITPTSAGQYNFGLDLVSSGDGHIRATQLMTLRAQ